MHRSPRVSVIIPTYNRSAVLRYAIRSVLAQTFADFELLVIGDGCTDDSEAVVKAFGDSRIRWSNLPQNTKHQSAPNNEGLRQARGELIAYLGHDDLWLPQHLDLLTKGLDLANADLAYSFSINVMADGESIWPTIPRPERGSFASPLCVVHRRSVTERIGGWRDYRELAIGPDVELWRRAFASGVRFTFVPRLTGVKFPGSWRRDVYKTLPSHEQESWLGRIENEPDFEQRQLVSLVVSSSAGRGLPFREVLTTFVRQLRDWVRMRFSLPWFGLAYTRRGGIDAIRRYKGL